MLGDGGERGQHGERVGAADDVQVVDEPVLLPQPEPFGQEQEVELGPFGRLGQMHERAEGNVTARPRIAPHGRVVDPGKMNCQVNLLHGAHRPSLDGTSTTTAALEGPGRLVYLSNENSQESTDGRPASGGGTPSARLTQATRAARRSCSWTRARGAKVSLTRTTWRPARSSRLAAMPARKPAAQWTQTVPRGISRIFAPQFVQRQVQGPVEMAAVPFVLAAHVEGHDPGPAHGFVQLAKAADGVGAGGPHQGGDVRHSARPDGRYRCGPDRAGRPPRPQRLSPTNTSGVSWGRSQPR